MPSSPCSLQFLAPCSWLPGCFGPHSPGSLRPPTGSHQRDFISGTGGIGKTTALRYLALSWAEGSNTVLKKFHFVFHISLKEVKPGVKLEEIITRQHKALHANGVTPKEIAEILNNDTQYNILVLMDGYDEYRKINSSIDSVIEKDTLWNCWIVLTSRPTDGLDEIRIYMDAEAEIKGFNEEQIQEYATKILKCRFKAEAMLQLAMESGIEDLLHIPILLQMVCILFQTSESLPDTKTGIIKAIVERCIKNDNVRNGHKTIKLEDMTGFLDKLGRISWDTLRNRVQQLLIDKV